MAKDIAIIQVCFNLLDPYQRALYDRAAGFPNRSGYVKRLIQWDAERAGRGKLLLRRTGQIRRSQTIFRQRVLFKGG
ncbi:hypothetical protein [Paenibacillus harenae]|uniref:hypothetical protein n=1 Tax=Paenibacillus harenae TaxID=306543 RepID=UPI0005623FB4|nr:hypothetical protein [Paenibacillus harenae]